MVLKTSLGIGALILATNCGHALQDRIESTPEDGCVNLTLNTYIKLGEYFFAGKSNAVVCDLTDDGLVDLIDLQYVLRTPDCPGGIYTQNLPPEYIQGCSLSSEQWKVVQSDFVYMFGKK